MFSQQLLLKGRDNILSNRDKALRMVTFALSSSALTGGWKGHGQCLATFMLGEELSISLPSSAYLEW